MSTKVVLTESLFPLLVEYYLGKISKILGFQEIFTTATCSKQNLSHETCRMT